MSKPSAPRPQAGGLGASLAQLNPAQTQAVRHLEGPCLVLAGAGSGKTKVITEKIAYLLRSGYQPGQVAAITFTNKAAQEMRERAKALVGSKAAKELVIATFHALGVRFLREEGEHLGLKPQFSILDSDDVLSLLKDAGNTTDIKQARSWQWQISLWKNQGMDADAAALTASDEMQHQAAVVMRLYQERLAAYQAVDFDDLIGLPGRLLTQNEAVRARWQDRLRYLLVDEYQDTNGVQYDLLRQLVGERARFTAVGDDDQSIYGWRGATIDNLKRLPQDYPGLTVIPLEQNYRSTSHILRAANAVIGHNPKMFEKRLWSDLGEGEPVRVLQSSTEEHEAERAVAAIQSKRAQGGASVKFSDFAVLYRANHQARAFEKALRKAQIPYKVSGGQSFFDRAEIKDLCAWLRLWVNPDDDPAFLRAITTPKRGIGHQTLKQLGEFASTWKLSLYDALFAQSLGSVMNAKAYASLQEFGRYANDLEYRARHTRGHEAAKAFLLSWLDGLGYQAHLMESEDQEKVAAARWTNVLDFVDWVARRCGGQVDDTGGISTETESKSLLEVAQSLSIILSLMERGEDSDQVVLSTLHASKGLEWPHVFLAGVNEGTLPFFAEEGELDAQRLEEERRLMYVGITRARLTLTVSVLEQRKRARQNVRALPSRFVEEMKLKEAQSAEDPRERLKAWRQQMADRLAAQAEASKGKGSES